MTTIYNTLHGIGDNLMIAALLRGHAIEPEAWVVTDFPWIYEGIKANFAPSGAALRASVVSRDKSKLLFTRDKPMPRWGRTERHFWYHTKPELGMVGAAADSAKIPGPPDWSTAHLLRPLAEARAFVGVPGNKPLAVVRPVTTRAEYRADNRACLPIYIHAAAAALMETHYVVSIASTSNHHEHLVGTPPPAHLHVLKGELPIEQSVALTIAADAAVLPIGWAIIAAAIGNVPTLRVFGQAGRYNSPDFFRGFGGNNVDALPDSFDAQDATREVSDEHKVISNFDDRLDDFLSRLHA